MAARQIKLTIAYDGGRYRGWQVQPDQPTVQGALEDALEAILAGRVQTTGCGRTDAGVHALAQTVTFLTESTIPAEAFRPALNGRLPGDITVLNSCEVPRDFHPIADIVGKRYRYLLCDGPLREIFLRRYAWQVRHRLDAARMDEASRYLLGTHDFSSFESAGSPRESSVRTVRDVSVRREGVAYPFLLSNADQAGQGRGAAGLVTVEIEADGFLYNMVRSIVGTLVEVGRGVREPEWVREVLEAQDRSAAGRTAPPQGLFMLRTTYPDERQDFMTPDDSASHP